jgi:hypothetical protein
LEEVEEVGGRRMTKIGMKRKERKWRKWKKQKKK